MLLRKIFNSVNIWNASLISGALLLSLPGPPYLSRNKAFWVFCASVKTFSIIQTFLNSCDNAKITLLTAKPADGLWLISPSMLCARLKQGFGTIIAQGCSGMAERVWFTCVRVRDGLFPLVFLESRRFPAICRWATVIGARSFRWGDFDEVTQTMLASG